MSFLIPNIFVILLFDLVFTAMMAAVSVYSLKITRKWNSQSTDDTQAELEKRSILISLIIRFITALKIPMLFLLIYSTEKMSVLPSGTACCYTVLSSTLYGKLLFLLTVINIFALAVWLIIDFYDHRSETSPYTVVKAKTALWIMPMIAAETALFIFTFIMTSVSQPEIYSAPASQPIGPEAQLISAFFLCLTYAVLTWGYLRGRYNFFYGTNIFFLLSAAISLVYLTGVYVYQAPVIRCPFCMLSDTYEQAGYFFFGFLFIGTASGLGAMVMKLISGTDKKHLIRTAIFFNTLYFLLSIYYPLRYLLINRVWL